MPSQSSSTEADKLYLEDCPDYFEVQRKDLFWYERLWSVLLRELEKRTDERWLLEFGSGPGFLLRLADRRGWHATGIEPSNVAREYARSIGAKCYSEKFRRLENWWPAAIATEVLEHVDVVGATLMEWHAALRPGGYLALSVPNDSNPLQRLFWKKSKPWITPLHRRYYNPKRLREDLDAAGFEVVWQRTSFPVELLLVLPIPRKWAWKLSRIWPAPPLLWRFHVGRHCLVVARKPEPELFEGM